ncbi:MAG: hypothetical protein F7C35_03605 [Desulfurococcales archaeon]|nr:hypothetical protein [Desulfurococcales archaeon]
MNVKRGRTRSLLVLAALVVVTVMVSYAGVVAINRVNVTLNQVQTPVALQPGGNANKPGFEGTNITVTVNSVGTEANVTVSIPNGVVVVHDILRVVNNSATNTTYYIELIIPPNANNPDLSQYFYTAEVWIRDSNGAYTTNYLDLITGQYQGTPVQVPNGGYLILDLLLVPKPTAWTAGTSVSFSFGISYSNNQTVLGEPLPP